MIVNENTKSFLRTARQVRKFLASIGKRRVHLHRAWRTAPRLA